LITSASDSIECIPSGPAPPTPPPPAIPFTISGIGSGTVTGAFGIGIQGSGTFVFTVTGGTTDGNTFSLTGETSPGIFCGDEVQRFTISGDCGSGVEIRYEEPDVSSTFTGNVQCVLT
jgi:hypothetical protein